MKQKNKIILSLGGIVTLLLITIGLSYAYFTANITGGEDSTTITVTGGRMNIYYAGGADINVEDIVPKDNPIATKTFTVTGNNTTDQEMRYKISLEVVANTFTEEALKYKLISENTDSNGTVAPSITDLTDIGTGAKTIELGIGEFASPTGGNKVHTYNLELYFLNQDYNQNEDQGKEIRAYVKIENDPCAAGNCLRDLILAQGGGAETIEAKGNPDFYLNTPGSTITGYSENEPVEVTSVNIADIIIGDSYTFGAYDGYYKYQISNYSSEFEYIYTAQDIGKYICDLWDNEGDGSCDIMYRITEVTGDIITKAMKYEYEPTYEVPHLEHTGLYAAEDEYGMSYYYRGDRESLNNNLIFGGYQWKIIRINGDESIRIIYNGTGAQFTANGTMNTTGENTQISGTHFWNEDPYVGYMYNYNLGEEGIEIDGNIFASNAKAVLDSWYETNISDQSFESNIVDNIFCNDREMSHSEPNFYASLDRLNDMFSISPTLKCTQKNDRFTKTDTTLGNGALTYPVGLLTADEAYLAGYGEERDVNDWFLANPFNYLNTNLNYWLLTPIVQSEGNVQLSSMSIVGIVSASYGVSSNGLRPVLNLSSNIKVTGNGSATNPYRVV